MPALMLAAACRDDRLGECGDGGVLILVGSVGIAMLKLGRLWLGDVESESDGEFGNEFRSGAIAFDLHQPVLSTRVR